MDSEIGSSQSKANCRKLENMEEENKHNNYIYDNTSSHLNCADNIDNLTKEGLAYCIYNI